MIKKHIITSNLCDKTGNSFKNSISTFQLRKNKSKRQNKSKETSQWHLWWRFSVIRWHHYEVPKLLDSSEETATQPTHACMHARDQQRPRWNMFLILLPVPEETSDNQTATVRGSSQLVCVPVLLMHVHSSWHYSFLIPEHTNGPRLMRGDTSQTQVNL